MKRSGWIVVLVLVAAAWVYFLSRPPSHVTSGGEQTAVPNAEVPQSPAQVSQKSKPDQPSSTTSPVVASDAVSAAAASTTAPTPLTATAPDFTAVAPEVVLDHVRAAVTLYGHTFNGNPVGNNAEITSALNGENPKQIKFLPADSGARINSNGELIDNWGTPFFFHQLSGTETEIRSAGPDRKMWTSDDLVTR